MVAKRKKYLAPALLSFFVAGLGQIIKGDAKKGLKIMLWFYLGLPILLYGAMLLNAYIFLVIFAFSVVFYPVFWVLNIVDAYSFQFFVRRRA